MKYWRIIERRMSDGAMRDVTVRMTGYSGFENRNDAVALMAYAFIDRQFRSDENDAKSMIEQAHIFMTVMTSEAVTCKGCEYFVDQCERRELKNTSEGIVEPYPPDEEYEDDHEFAIEKLLGEIPL